MAQPTIYAKIEDGIVVEFPVSIEEVAGRDNPSEIYVECHYLHEEYIDPASLKLYQKIEETAKMFGPIVVVRQVIVLKTLEELYNYLYMNVTFTDGVVDPTQIPQALYVGFYEVVKDDVQKQLDALAHARDYDSIISLCDYRASSIPRFATEGQYGYDQRDLAWETVNKLFADIQTGAIPVPMTAAELRTKIPVISWEGFSHGD